MCWQLCAVENISSYYIVRFALTAYQGGWDQLLAKFLVLVYKVEITFDKSLMNYI
jgi:hypothetical protein